LRHLLTALVMGIALPVTALAETYEPATMAYPIPVRGTVAEYSNGATVTVVDVSMDGSVMLVKEEHPEWGETLIRYSRGLGRLAMHWEDEAGMPEAVVRSFDPAIFAAVWPLTPGYTTSYTMLEVESDGDREDLAATLEVLEPRTATTPMGEVTAWVVRMDYDVDGNPDRRNTYDLWFAEGFPLPVKVEMRLDYEGEAPESDGYELIGYRLPE
jgi:hypothetical protein